MCMNCARHIQIYEEDEMYHYRIVDRIPQPVGIMTYFESLDGLIKGNMATINICHQALKYHKHEKHIDRELDLILECLDEISKAIDKAKNN